MGRNLYGADFSEKVCGVPEVTGVDGGERVEVVFDVVCNVISGAVAVGNYWSAGRNLKGNRPSIWVLVYLGEEVEFAGSGVVRSEKKIALFGSDEFLDVQ